MGERVHEDSLVAMGKAGGFTVEVLRWKSGWLMSIQSPPWSFDFELASLGAVRELRGFLRSYTGRAEFAELVLGSFSGANVQIVKDDEFADQFFLRVVGGRALIEFPLGGGCVRAFAGAVAEVDEELVADWGAAEDRPGE